MSKSVNSCLGRCRGPDAIHIKECRAAHLGLSRAVPHARNFGDSHCHLGTNWRRPWLVIEGVRAAAGSWGPCANVVGDSPLIAHRKELHAKKKRLEVRATFAGAAGEAFFVEVFARATAVKGGLRVVVPLETGGYAILTSAYVPSRKRSKPLLRARAGQHSTHSVHFNVENLESSEMWKWKLLARVLSVCGAATACSDSCTYDSAWIKPTRQSAPRFFALRNLTVGGQSLGRLALGNIHTIPLCKAIVLLLSQAALGICFLHDRMKRRAPTRVGNDASSLVGHAGMGRCLHSKGRKNLFRRSLRPTRGLRRRELQSNTSPPWTTAEFSPSRQCPANYVEALPAGHGCGTSLGECFFKR